jgi:hypothetical protein
VDEFQSFANESFANILSEARKYKLSLTMAHQYIEQMSEEVRAAVFGNVGTIICFRVGPFDAEVLEKVFAPTFTEEDLVNLGFAQIYLTLMIDGVGSPPFSAVTLPPIPLLSESQRELIIAYNQKTYARPRTVVEGDIEAWHRPIAPKSPPPIERRSDLTPPRQTSFTPPPLPTRPRLSLNILKSPVAPRKEDNPAAKAELRESLKTILKERSPTPPLSGGNSSRQSSLAPAGEIKKVEAKEVPKEELEKMLRV